MNVVVKLIIGLAALLSVVIGLIIGIGFFLSPQDDLKKTDMIVAISGGETSQRTLEAVRLYKQGYAPVLLFSGAAADTRGPSNAAAMARHAQREGVPESAILIEEKSKTTAENAADVSLIVRQQNARSLILVTSPYHQRRASLSFSQELGPEVELINHSAVDSVWRKSAWWEDSYTRHLTVSELNKTVYVWSTRSQRTQQ